jgi:hypothetical protein
MIPDRFRRDRPDDLRSLNWIQIGDGIFFDRRATSLSGATKSINFALRGTTMLIRLAYDIQFDIPATVAMVTLLNVHPSRAADLLEPDELQTEPGLEITRYIDSFGNRFARFVAPPGQLRLSGSTLIRDSGFPDEVNWYAREHAVGDLPHEVLRPIKSMPYERAHLKADPESDAIPGLSVNFRTL